MHKFPVGFRQRVRGVRIHLTVVAVHDQRLAVRLEDGQVHRAHHGRYAERAGQDRHMGIDRPRDGHDSLQPLGRHVGQHAGRDLLADEYRPLREVALACADILQVGEHAQAEVFDVRRPLLEVGVLHLLEAAHVFPDHVLQGALGPTRRRRMRSWTSPVSATSSSMCR